MGKLKRGLAVLGFAGDLHFLWFTLGAGFVGGSLVTGAAAVFSVLPWWSLAGLFVGVFLLMTGFAGTLVRLVLARQATHHPATGAPHLSDGDQARATRSDPTMQRKASALDETIGIEYDRLVADTRHNEQDQCPYDPGLLVGPVVDVFKRRRYDELGMSGDFAPNIAQGRLALQLMADTFRELGSRKWTDRELRTFQIRQRMPLERCAENVVEMYAPHRLTGYRLEHGLPYPGTPEGNAALDMNAKAKKLQAYRDEM
ncbi:MAG: hypothetical protein ABSE70_07580 [Candidatus Limnocylindrales bacterium]